MGKMERRQMFNRSEGSLSVDFEDFCLMPQSGSAVPQSTVQQSEKKLSAAGAKGIHNQRRRKACGNAMSQQVIERKIKPFGPQYGCNIFVKCRKRGIEDLGTCKSGIPMETMGLRATVLGCLGHFESMCHT